MLKRGIALLLMLVLFVGMLPLGATAQENEKCHVCGQHKTVQRIGLGGEVYIGQTLLSSGVNVALEYPNNPPAHVDTAEEKAVWIADQCRAKGITDPWKIALWLHDWLIYNANYDYTYSRYTADGVLLHGTGVCDSYARAYNLLLQQFGIESKRLTSDEMNHAWNLVKIDGQWCHIDVTWDDPNEGGYENHSYFGLTDERMGQDHDWDRTDSGYPACTSDINYYPVRMGIGFTTKQELVDILNKRASEKVEEIEVFYLGNDPAFPMYECLNEWYQSAYWEYGFTNGYFVLGENYAMVCVEYPDSDMNDHVHQYQPLIQKPSCASEGYTIYICNECGDQYTDDYVNPLGHTGGTATCAEKAVCTRCGEAYGDLKADNHAGGLEVKNTKTPTCTEPGYTGDTYCVGCGVKVSSGEAIAPAGHVAQPIPTVPASCTTPGATGGKQCYVCGQVLEPQTPMAATGHTDRNKDYSCDICYEKLCTDHQEVVIPAIPAGCTGVGATEGKQCSICGEILVAQQIIPATGHNWQAATCTTPRTCTNCGITSGTVVGHLWASGNCTTPKTCVICGETGTAAGHTYAHKYDYKCDICGAERTVDMTRPMVDMFRMYDPNSGEHFYTGSMEERENLVAVGWQYEGVGFTFPLTTGDPVHRLYDPATGEHLYTMDIFEMNRLLARGWNYEGIAFNSGFENEVPQYRLHNPNASRGAYHFTASIEERDFLISLGWEYQGIGWYSLGA